MLEKLLSFALDMRHRMQFICPAEYIMLTYPPEYWASIAWTVFRGDNEFSHGEYESAVSKYLLPADSQLQTGY